MLLNLHQGTPTSRMRAPMNSEESDDELLCSYCQQADRAALEQLFERYINTAFHVAYASCGHSQDAADAVQDAFFQIMRGAHTFKSRSSVRTWIMSAVVHACHNRRRSETRIKKREAAFVAQQEQERRAEQAAFSDEAQECFEVELYKLPKRYRLPLVLRYNEGCSVAEIATVLNQTQNTVRKQLNRAVEKLRTQLSARGYQTSSGIAVAAGLQQLSWPAAPASLGTSVSAVAAGGSMSTGVLIGLLPAGMNIKIISAALTVLIAAGLTWSLQTEPPEPSEAVVGIVEEQQGPVLAAEPADPQQPDWSKEMIVVRTWNASEVLNKILRRRGLEVVMFGKRPHMITPVALRNKETNIKDLVDRLSSAWGFKADWQKKGQHVLLSQLVSDEKLKAFKRDWESGDLSKQIDAAWRSGWYGDLRIVPLLADKLHVPELKSYISKNIVRQGLAAAVMTDQRFKPLLHESIVEMSTYAAQENRTLFTRMNVSKRITQVTAAAVTLGDQSLVPDLLNAFELVHDDYKKDIFSAISIIAPKTGLRRALKEPVGESNLLDQNALYNLAESVPNESVDLLKSLLHSNDYVSTSSVLTIAGETDVPPVLDVLKNLYVNELRTLPAYQSTLEVSPKTAEERQQREHSLAYMDMWMKVSILGGLEQSKLAVAEELMKLAVQDTDPHVKLAALVFMMNRSSDRQKRSALAAQCAEMLKACRIPGREGVASALLSKIKYSDPAAIDLIKTWLQQCNQQSYMPLMDALGRMGSDEAAVFIVSQLGHENAQMRVAALSGLEKLDPTLLAKHARSMRQDKDPNVARMAGTLMYKYADIDEMAADILSGKEKITSDLYNIIDSFDGLVAEDIIEKGIKQAKRQRFGISEIDMLLPKLLEIGSPRSLELLEQALSTNAGSGAAETIASMNTPESLAVLKQGLASGNRRTKSNVVIGLGRLHTPESIALLESVLDGNDKKLYGTTANALGRIGNDQALEALRKYFNDGNEERRVAAIGGLYNFQNRDAEIIEILKKYINDESDEVRFAVARVLTKQKLPEAKNLMMKQLLDSYARVRETAAGGLLFQAVNSGQADDAFDLFDLLLNSEDVSIRMSAVRGALFLKRTHEVALRKLLIESLEKETDVGVQRMMINTLKHYYGEHPDVKQALSKVQVIEQPAQQAPRKQKRKQGPEPADDF